MSKERARRRAEREREAAVRAAARAAVRERRERKAARRRALTSWLSPRLFGGTRPPAGSLAARRRQELTLFVVSLVVLNVMVWLALPGWAARLGALLVTVLAAPVLYTFLLRR